ncbi:MULTISPECIES: nuclear transport factor 2 family protein [unclassified Streptomyces]|uniref:nuclear transport factor 2 family protein n=1 Tax=unclassified Streptomyces TaxID=2593676 RepID=UPI000938FA5C|nr:nuclear transport factor 2 family protein [Streptomyces sp. CB02400]OKK13460.1 polyketide cyclase [Streptomyces sp. CB02400]
MSGFEELARRYLASWNERDPARRRALVDELWTDDAGYVDPIVTAEGRDAIEDVVATAQRQFPGLVYRPAGKVDGHHDVARLAWELAPAGGPAVIVGLAVMVAERSRLRRVYGFLDPVPAVTTSPGAGS